METQNERELRRSLFGSDDEDDEDDENVEDAFHDTLEQEVDEDQAYHAEQMPGHLAVSNASGF